jgi:CRISP-associated protein Cas1
MFRVPLADMPILGAINRRTFDPSSDFCVWGNGVSLSDEGKRKLITVFERRLQETWRHDVVGQSELCTPHRARGETAREGVVR